jgi:ribosomal protein S18 acetylase RimI-like enzyme
MKAEIEHISQYTLQGFRDALDIVVRERKHLAMLEAPPLSAVQDWVGSNIKKGIPQFVALVDGTVVGWCDVMPKEKEGFKHVGVLGMGVLPNYRRCGIGTKLLRETVAAARAFGLERIELEVFASNDAAVALYLRHGFVEEGRLRKSRKLDGAYDDQILMARFLVPEGTVEQADQH